MESMDFSVLRCILKRTRNTDCGRSELGIGPILRTINGTTLLSKDKTDSKYNCLRKSTGRAPGNPQFRTHRGFFQWHSSTARTRRESCCDLCRCYGGAHCLIGSPSKFEFGRLCSLWINNSDFLQKILDRVGLNVHPRMFAHDPSFFVGN